MNPRATAILLAITVALGAFVLFYELREDRDSGGPGPEVGRIFADPSLDPDMVESLSFTTEEGTPARIERREGRWWVVEPDHRRRSDLRGLLLRLRQHPRGPG